MAHFLNKDPSDTTYPWLEWHIQAYIVQELRRMGYLVIGDMAAGKRNPGMAKAVGLIAGHPDLSIWLSLGRVVLVELKTSKGRLSKEQIAHHEKLTNMGHSVHTIYANCPMDGLNQVLLLLPLSTPTPKHETMEPR